MDPTKALASGVAVVAPGASSGYQLAPRAENLGPGMLPMASPVISSGSEKKKRGRPRKYKPDDSSSRVFSPVPLSASAPPAIGKSYEEVKKPSPVQPITSEKKQRNKVGAEKLDGWTGCFTGSSFLPHVLNVNIGEDISEKIMEFSLHGPRSVCILSGSGLVSNITIRHPSSSDGTLTYEGLFEIISFTGSFNPTDNPGTKFGRAGKMTICLSGADGRIVGGSIAGRTIAAGPVMILVASYLLSSSNELKPKKLKTDAAASTVNAAAGPSGGPAINMEKSPSEGPSCSILENPTSWPAAQLPERSRASAADINISLQG